MAAVPVVPTWQAGQRVLASQLQQLSDASTFLLNTPVFVAAQAATQSIPSGTITALTWPTPSLDTYAGWAAGSPTKYTPQLAGYYDLVGDYMAAPNATGNRDVLIQKNGAAIAQNGILAATASDNTGLQVVADMVFFNGSTDYFEVAAVQRSGGALNTVVGFTQVSARFVHA